MNATSLHDLRNTLAGLWRIPPQSLAAEWIPQHVVIPEETETPGPFDLSLVPHVRGVLEDWDDPAVRTIRLCWAARLAKTTTALALLTHAMCTAPRPALFVGPDAERTHDTVAHQLLPLLEATPAAARLLPTPSRRTQRHITLGPGRIRLGSSGSPSSLAGFPACYVICSEVSKWSRRRSSEADPLYLAAQRAKNYPFDSKIIYESTPSLEGECQITLLMRQPGVDQRTRWVPCPHCGLYQQLVFGDADPDTPGLKWHRDRSGRSDPGTAEETAFYRCAAGCRIENEDRPALLRRGIWLSSGQTIDRAGRISGARPGSPDVAYGPLSSLHSLLVAGWGQLARDWLRVHDDPAGRRDYFNATLCLIWDPAPAVVESSDLIARLGTDDPLRHVPEWVVFLTAGADVAQAGEDLLFHWVVCGWGRGGRGQLIDLGIDVGIESFRRRLAPGAWCYRDHAGRRRPVERIGVDSGSFAQTIYELVRPYAQVWPVKGSSISPTSPFTSGDWPDMYRPGMQAAGRHPRLVEALRRRGHYDLIVPNTHRTQQWLEDRLTGIVRREDPGWFSVPIEALDGECLPGVDLIRHLTGDVLVGGAWRKRWDRQDFRDAVRYARVMAELRTGGGRRWDRLTTLPPAPLATPAQGEEDEEERDWLAV